MPVGLLNPSDDARAASTRPAAVPSGAASRRWYSDDLHTIVTQHDMNAIIAQIRDVIDYYSIPDVEGDDTLLRQAIGNAALSLTGNIAALQGLSGSADKGIHFTGGAAMAVHPLSSYSRGLLGNTTLTAWQAALGISAGSSPNVIALGALAGGADQLPYFNGVGTMDQTPFTSTARALLDDTSVGAMRTTLGLLSGATADITLYAPLASPPLTGTPTAPTAAPGTSTTQLATTAFVTLADALKAPLASPALTGTPTAPTAAAATNTTQIATTAFVQANLTALGLGGLAFKTTIVNADVAAGAAIVLTKLADMSNNHLLGNVSGAPAPPTILTATQVKTLLAIASTDVSGLGGLATKTTIANVDVAAGAAIALSKLAAIANNNLLGNISGSSAAPAALTAAQAKTLLAIVAADVSGLGALATKNQTAAGDYVAGSIVAADIGLQQITTPRIADDAVVANKIADGAVTGGKILDGVVTLAKLYDIATATLLGRSTAGTGPVSALTAAQAKTLLAITSADVSGLDAALALKAPLLNPVFTGTATIERLGVGSSILYMDVLDTYGAWLFFRTGTSTRWVMGKTATAESGLSAGSDFVINAYADAGTLIGTALTITRSSRVVDFAVNPSVAGVALGALATKSTIVNADVDAAAAIAYSKLVAIPDQRILGNVAGVTQTAAALTVAQVKTMLAYGTAASQNTGTSGANVPLLNGANTHSGASIFSASLNVTGKLVVGPTTYTLSANTAGAITVTGSMARVDTFAAAASGELATINGNFGTGHILVIMCIDNLHDIVVVESGNINLNVAGPFTLNSIHDTLVLIYGNAMWYELCRSDNG